MVLSAELASAILSFLGGAMLSIDALRARHRARAESGAKKFLEIMRAHGTGTTLKDEQGRDLDSEAALALWRARQSTRWTWIGFLLMTAGFVVQIAAAGMKSPN